MMSGWREKKKLSMGGESLDIYQHPESDELTGDESRRWLLIVDRLFDLPDTEMVQFNEQWVKPRRVWATWGRSLCERDSG